MAKMYPAEIPKQPKSEQQVLLALKELPDTYHVFHSINWLNLSPNPRDKNKQRIGETDAVIVHAKHGVLVVEVKGGQEIRVENGDWFSVAHHSGRSHRLSRSPAKQARDNLYLLKQKLEKENIFKPYVFDQGLLGYAVWFPGIDKTTAASLPLDLASDAQVFDKSSLFNPLADVEEAFESWRPKHSTATLDKMQLARICKVISPDIAFVPSLKLHLQQQEDDMITLTHEQQQAFSMTLSNRRLLVSGGAGTGKTLLAIEDAKEQLRAGKKTLFLCFNKFLSEYLKKELADQDNITINCFHGFVEQLCQQSGITFKVPKKSKKLSHFFHEKSPFLLMEAADKLTEKYDALIVDEGQDFLPDWWDALECVLIEKPVFHCFHDANQAIFQKEWQPPFEEPKYGPLNINCRNTTPIGKLALQLAGIKQAEQYKVIEGVQPEIMRYKKLSKQRKLIEELLTRWIEKGKLTPDRIVILSPYRREGSVVAGDKIGRWNIHDLHPNTSKPASSIAFATIHAFKGLEADAVIIADIDGGGWAMNKQALYVAASRAKHLLAICVHKNANINMTESQ